MLCDMCNHDEATLMRRGGLMWNPICWDCAEWFSPDRIAPLDVSAVIADEVEVTLLELQPE